ncbi:hypothetical protein WAX74_14525 [Psychrobacillus sp. FJAT-51614]|uniref:DUF5105 domain-containing protein n=1 Tax=Psychrobacillus mangrovi TaxID=3117745 RepID=A0ABU8F754_9BACI
MIKRLFIPLSLLILLTGCQNESPVASAKSEEGQVKQLLIENERLTNQLIELKKDKEEENEDLRTTMNLTFKLLTALEKKDFEYISSISSPNVQVNEKESILFFKRQKNSHEISSNKEYSLENLEYRFYELEEDKMTIGFAEYFFEGHSTIYFEFIRQDETWLIDFIVTDA